MKLSFAKCLFLFFLLITAADSSSQTNIRNPWGMNQQQYELWENTSVPAINNLPGVHPTYGALSLPDVSYVTSQYDNGPAPAGSTIAQFRFQAAPSHYLKDDPIIYPNQPGASHLHMFFGNTRADAYSVVGTGSSNDLLVKGASTVQGGKGANPSSYWMPALVDGPLTGCNDQRNIILPDAITVYYKTRRPGESQIIPEGLELIGGNLTHNPGSGMLHGMQITNSGGGTHRSAAIWGFYDPARGLIPEGRPTIPQSNPNGYKWLRCVIGFPSCFRIGPNGGFLLSSDNHLSHQHMLEDAGGWNRDDLQCPSSHPMRIPKVEILIDFRWPADGDVSGWRLASDLGARTDAQVPYPGGSLHGDILFAWNNKVQQAWKDEVFDPNDPRNASIGQTGHQWNLDRIANTETITNQFYYGPTNIPDPYDICNNCPPAETACDDNNPNTINDVHDGFCNCTGLYCPPEGTTCNDNDTNTINDMYDGFCSCRGTYCPPSGTACDDNDTTTEHDAYNGSCQCVGIPIIPGPSICQFETPLNLNGYDGEWASVTPLTVSKVLAGTVANSADLSAEFKLAYDDLYLYVFGKVKDNSLQNDSPNPWNDDSVELYIDGGHERSTTYDANDFQLMFRYGDPVAYNVSGGVTNPQGLDHVMTSTSTGYDVEIRISWAFIGITNPAASGNTIGLDIHINDDDDGGTRDKHISWHDTQNVAWTNTSVFNEILFESCVDLNCPASGTPCDDADPNTINDIEDGFCNCTGNFCPPPGTVCDDNDPTTNNDVYDNLCNCAGMTCPNAGTICDDNDPTTFNDVHDGFCNCTGTNCPLAGTQCDDNNPLTINDQYDSLCDCSGIPVGEDSGNCQFDVLPVIDGYDNEWAAHSTHHVLNLLEGTVGDQSDLSATFKVGWDDTNLYVFGKVHDSSLQKDSPYPWHDDSFELYIDGGNEKKSVYDNNDFQLMFGYNDPIAYNVSGGVNNPQGLDFVMLQTTVGYDVEIRISWSFIGINPVQQGSHIGLDVHINDDDDGGTRDKHLSFHDLQNLAYTDPSVFEELKFENCESSNCPALGTICDDNDPTTFDDIEDGFCVCAGTKCPPINTACNDNNPNTINDKHNGYCMCEGTPVDTESGNCQFLTPPLVDGFDYEWGASMATYDVSKVLSGTITNQQDLSAEFKVGWDDAYVYIFGAVIDDSLMNDSSQAWHDDSFELYIDGRNDKNTTYDLNDHQLFFAYDDPIVYNNSSGIHNPQGIDFVMVETGTGYQVEIRLSWAFMSLLSVNVGDKIGLDIHINDDDDGGARDKSISWNDSQNIGYTNPSVFGEIELEECFSESCPHTLYLETTQPTGVYKADQEIHSSGIIKSGSNVRFEAGQEILLNAGFEVEHGSTFEVNLEFCN